MSGCVWERLAWNWACDSSLEPSCYKNDNVMGKYRFGRTARPPAVSENGCDPVQSEIIQPQTGIFLPKICL